MVTSGFETDIYPATSARGCGVIILTLGGALFSFIASQVDPLNRAAFPMFLGAAMLFGAFCIHFNHQNFELHRDGHRYRYFYSLFGINMGEWQQLPAVTGVIMKYFSETPIAGQRGWQVQGPLAYCIVMLSTEAANHQGIIVYKFPYRRRTQAIELTNELARYFAVEPHFYDEA